MRSIFRSKVFLVSIVFAIVVCCAMVLYSFMKRSDSDRRNILTTLLEAPFFISSAEAQTTTTFPEDQAGISAYVKILGVDIEKIKSILTEVEAVGDNYIYGVTPIPNFGGPMNIHVYADTDGWLVAYIRADEPAAMIMQWGDAEPLNPEIGEILSTTLEDALYGAADAMGAVVSQRDIKYYDFEAPEANGMALFIKTRIGKGANIVQVELPATYTLYEASFYHFMAYSGWNENIKSELRVDESRISYMEGTYIKSAGIYWKRVFESYKGAVTTGILHKIEIALSTDSNRDCSVGAATVMVYKGQ